MTAVLFKLALDENGSFVVINLRTLFVKPKSKEVLIFKEFFNDSKNKISRKIACIRSSVFLYVEKIKIKPKLVVFELYYCVEYAVRLTIRSHLDHFHPDEYSFQCHSYNVQVNFPLLFVINHSTCSKNDTTYMIWGISYGVLSVGSRFITSFVFVSCFLFSSEFSRAPEPKMITF